LGFFLSLAALATPEGAILARSIIPGISERMPYAGPANFTGQPVPGYGGPHCWLHPLAAKALAKVVRDATQAGLTLELYDCYRPKSAVDAFVAWSHNRDERTKARFYPHLSKDTLFPLGYIALDSTHRTGLSIDLCIQGLDFGTPFDFFDPRSGSHAVVSKRAQQNRTRLRVLMERNGFRPYEQEWWHFTLRLEPLPSPLEGDIPP
jgi:D-alanyl-D-alanine dipeptidase